ncbi:hypothetical protein LEP1GSC034_0231 [Leptospira interrogans str. 2003000735]|uniref:Uncharacterized protein n=1 Tax=Leptospira interrogans str. 2002000626 TaxID=996803 RepID=A0A829CZM6_LEPIR|nr:hypothetical protein [Leptospira interrogans]EMY02075.1 hypothetical protein LEP1GSC029_2074 [Leptospira interrogans str. 2002000626]EKN87355.1 hypothetical protein LEP1GSC027_3123 [Leptospira interrogans str. 2002000624]EKQ35979.1 hypothetical protein LEP1GSC025_3898 [Leptospira interrogans str. 2002000621]EKQ47482.1 hypothetical protein LEP1GSC026_4516 [Leptospira interrogans str. 2002000623]EMJ68143.1 hypothetical protein LEP1GSC034_0231 [Leptospira interrogans str. 2003000735]
MNFLSCACSILEFTNKKILPIPFIKNIEKLIFKELFFIKIEYIKNLKDAVGVFKIIVFDP